MQKNSIRIDAFIILALGIMLMPQKKDPEYIWYTPVDIGKHIDINDVAEEKLDKVQIRGIFTKDTIFQHQAMQKLISLKQEWFKKNGIEYLKKFENDKIFYLDKNDHPISANVYRLSKSKVKIYIQFVYGHSRWHHYYIVLKNYIVNRDPFIDEILNLVDLEKQYSFSFKGVSHGTSLDEAVKILGDKYYEYAGQSPQFQNIYYEEYNIELVIQDWIVKYIKKEKPGWMDTEMKYNNVK